MRERQRGGQQPTAMHQRPAVQAVRRKRVRTGAPRPQPGGQRPRPVRQQHDLPVQLLHRRLAGGQHQVELALNGLMPRQEEAPLLPYELLGAMAHRAVRRGRDGEHHAHAVVRLQQREHVHQPDACHHERHHDEDRAASRTEHPSVCAQPHGAVQPQGPRHHSSPPIADAWARTPL